MSDDVKAGFGKAWVEAEAEATYAVQLAHDFMKRYNNEDEIIESDRLLLETHMSLLYAVVAEIRALRLFTVARYANDEHEWEGGES